VDEHLGFALSLITLTRSLTLTLTLTLTQTETLRTATLIVVFNLLVRLRVESSPRGDEEVVCLLLRDDQALEHVHAAHELLDRALQVFQLKIRG
jgi:hypothetical protein